jgi:hypothetical protein
MFYLFILVYIQNRATINNLLLFQKKPYAY